MTSNQIGQSGSNKQKRLKKRFSPYRAAVEDHTSSLVLEFLSKNEPQSFF
jgi:hypothetical protein